MFNIKSEIYNKSLEIKKRIKELNNILSSLYNKERENNNKNVYFIKRTADKVSSAVKHLNNVQDLAKGKDPKVDEEISRKHKQTITNILQLQEYYQDKLRDSYKSEGSPEVTQLKKNIDYLRLAYEDLKRLDTDMNIDSRSNLIKKNSKEL